MRLIEARIKNFRGYKNEVSITFDSNITAVTGRNDAGKSSILEALDIYFEGGEVSIEKDDFCVESPDSPIEITCIFDDLPEKLVLDETYETSLSNEYLVNQNGQFELKKRFKRSSLTKPEVLICSYHPTAQNYSDLHSLKLADLKKRALEIGVSATAVSDARISSEWRKAIWRSQANLGLENFDLDISKFSADSKSVQEQIQKAMPLFALFKSDRESKDSDPQAKNPMQEAVKQAQAELRSRIEELEKEIQAKVIERANKTLEKLREMDPGLAEQLKPRFKNNPKWTFDFSLDGDGDIPINKRGSGVRRLVLLNFFRAEAERKVADKNAPSVIYAFEEPETSQHPANQEMLINALIDLSKRINCQVIVTTHVPALAALLPISGLRLIEKIDGKPVVSFGSDDVIGRIADSLGVLSEIGAAKAKALLLVEGPGDLLFFNHICNQLKSSGEINAGFEDKNILLVPIGGCGNLKHWKTKKIADQFGIPWGIVIDSDLGTSEAEKNSAAIETLKAEGKKAYLTRRREPENYIDIEVVRPHFIQSDINIFLTESCDAKELIGKATKIRAERVLEKFWPSMTLDKIRVSEMYVDSSGVEKFELTEMVKDFLTLV